MIIFDDAVALVHGFYYVLSVRLYMIYTTTETFYLVIKQGFFIAVDDEVELNLTAIYVAIVVHNDGFYATTADNPDDL